MYVYPLDLPTAQAEHSMCKVTLIPTLPGDLFDFNLWSPIELAVCYICSCCPTLGPLFTKLASLPSRFTGYGRSKISRITDTDETRELKNMDPSTSTTALAKTHREDHIEVSSYEMHQV